MLAANPPIVNQAASAKTHAAQMECRPAKKPAAKIPPIRVPSVALTAHSLGDPGHRPAMQIPTANALRIHSTGNFMEFATHTARAR